MSVDAVCTASQVVHWLTSKQFLPIYPDSGLAVTWVPRGSYGFHLLQIVHHWPGSFLWINQNPGKLTMVLLWRQTVACVLPWLWWQLVYPGDVIDMSTTAGWSRWGGDNYVLLTDEVTEVLWGYMPVPPLCGPQFLPLGLRSFSVLTVDAAIICPSSHNYLEAKSKVGQ